MAILAISRELAALGDETARELATKMGYRFVDKESLEQRIASYGFSTKKIERFDEKKPGFWASISRDKDDYLHYLKLAVYEEAERGNCIFVGRGAFALLKGLPAVISIRLVSPLVIRLERVKSYFQCDEKRARMIIEQSDRDRSAFHRYFFDLDWNNATNYHLTFNTGSIHPTLAAELVVHFVQQMVQPGEEHLLLNKLAGLLLGEHIVHKVLYTLGIPIHFMEAQVEDGRVILRGVASSPSAAEAAVAGAQQVPGVRQVSSEIQVVQEYSVMP
ncbi:MAG: cytidylate kinase family protein [Treponemataceae bacterium]|nr:cytidylate kinase family protein [Treponemataceae bacterium]